MRAARAEHCAQHGLNNCKMTCHCLEDTMGKGFGLCTVLQQVLQHGFPGALL